MQRCVAGIAICRRANGERMPRTSFDELHEQAKQTVAKIKGKADADAAIEILRVLMQVRQHASQETYDAIENKLLHQGHQ
jgi:F0F1-type ATP synthase membrane subunit b/b'